MKKRVNLKNRVSALVLSFFLVLGLNAPAFTINANAEALEVLNGATTIADCIMSYCASGGVAVMNETVINEVYNSLGTSFGTLQTFVDNGLLTYTDGTYVDTGLSVNIDSAIQNINSIDIGALFNQTAQQNPAGVAMTGAASLSGIAGSVASTGVLPIAVGVGVSGFCGFQIGNIIANMLGLYGDNAGKGFNINADENIVANIPKGNTNLVVINNNGFFYVYSGDGISIAYPSSSYLNYGLVNPNSTSITTKFLAVRANGEIVQNETKSISSWSEGTKSALRSNINSINATYVFNSASEFRNAVNTWQTTGNYKKGNVSPDLIGGDGNITGQYDSDNDQYQFPEVLPHADPSTQSINPSGLSLDDWLRFANSAKGNTGAGQPEQNTNVFSDIINALISNIPTPSPTPTPTPSPDGETYPYPGDVPNPTPVPDNDYQPETKPQPQYTEKQSENETDITEGDPWTTPDLLDKFPFCIPRDVYRVFTKLDSGARAAPHIQWRFNPNNKIDYTFDVDFSEWDSVATLLRTLELLGFIVALAVATRKMILS